MSVSTSSGNVSFSAFPANKVDALAILYVQRQDLEGKSPEDIAAMYYDAHSRISARLIELRKDSKQKEPPYRSILG